MTDTCVIRCQTASGKSLDEFTKLIALRVERLKELSKDAVIATAIDVLVSLRADTLVAEPGKSVDPPRRITPRGDLFISFRGKIPCLRVGSMHGPRYSGRGSFFFAGKGAKASELKVFQIVSRHERINPYFVAAHDVSEALQFEGSRIRTRVEKKGTLAKTALGVAMAKISTRNDGSSSKIAQILGSKLSHVTVFGDGFGEGSFGLSYSSELDYGIAALKSGDAGVDGAMQRAANKIAGQITHAAHQADDFEHDIKTPFPDVRRRR